MRFSAAIVFAFIAASAAPAFGYFTQYDARDLDAALYARDLEAALYARNLEAALYARGYAPRSTDDFELYVRADPRPPRPMPPKKPKRTYSVVYPPNFRAS